jgi:TonB family protein
MNWLHYLVEANIYLSVFYLFYCLLLNKETHYTLNRIYLLSSCALSFIIPLIQIGRLKPVEVAAQVSTTTVTTQVVYTLPGNQTVSPIMDNPLTLQDWLFYAYLAGAVVLFAVLGIKLYKLWLLSRAKPTAEQGGYKLIYMDGSNSAFSFFNFLFMGTSVPKADTIIRHELVHIRQIHSADIILLEVVKIINWFNPLIYLLQQSLKTVHEYIADELTAADEADTLVYSTFLVNNAYGVSGSHITNSFFNYNLLKKRIMMLHQQRSGGLARLKYLLAAPLCAALLCVSTLSFSKTYGWVDLAPAHELTNIKPVKNDDTIKYNKENKSVTPKGYHYREEGYLINNKADFRVVFSLKNGSEVDYFKNSATRAEIKLLKDKYGYTFPSIPIYNRMPPPPPAPPTNRPTPPKPKVDQIRFPAPMVYTNGYKHFAIHLINTIRYPANHLKNNEAAIVIVNFTVTTDHRLANTAIAKSGGADFDKAALTGFRFDFPISDKPGEHHFIIKFDPDGNGKYEKIDPDMYKAPGYAGEISIDARFPPKRVVDQVKFPPPVVKPDKLADTSFEPFYHQLAKTIHYPTQAHENKITGKVFAEFTVDADHHIVEVGVLRAPSENLANEVIRAIKACGTVPAAEAGTNYMIPVNFVLNGYDGAAIVDPSAKKYGTLPPVSANTSYLSEIVIVSYLSQPK